MSTKLSPDGKRFLSQYALFHAISDRLKPLYYATPLIWLPDIEQGKATVDVGDGWYAVTSDKVTRVFPTSLSASKAYVSTITGYVERGFTVNMVLPAFKGSLSGKVTNSEWMFSGSTADVLAVSGRDADYLRKWERESETLPYDNQWLPGCTAVSKRWHKEAKARYFRTYGRSKEQWLLENWELFSDVCADLRPRAQVVIRNGEVQGFSLSIKPSPVSWANQFRRALDVKPNQLSYHLWVQAAKQYAEYPLCLDGTAPTPGLQAFKEKVGMHGTLKLLSVCKKSS